MKKIITLVFVLAIIQPGFSQNKNLEDKDEKLKQANLLFDGEVYYVSMDGNNKNDGSFDAPFKNIDKAIETANAGDRIYVAEGTYSGSSGLCAYSIDKPLELYGSFSKDFSNRDLMKHTTIVQAGQGSSKKDHFIFKTTLDTDGPIIIDGFLLDMGEQQQYSKDKPDGVSSGYMKRTGEDDEGTPKRTGIYMLGNERKISNNVFVNMSNGAIQILQNNDADGIIEIENNVFAACASDAIECGGLPAAPRTIEIHHNTFVFSFGETYKDNKEGNAIHSKEDAVFNYHDNIIAYSSGAGIEHLSHDDETKIDYNLFWGNRKGALYTEMSNGDSVFLSPEEFPEVKHLESTDENYRKYVDLSLDEAYLFHYLSSSMDTLKEYNTDLDINKLNESINNNKDEYSAIDAPFFANKYPYKETLKIFGADRSHGAQEPELTIPED